MTEKEFFELLAHAISGSSEDHRHKRIEGLEELQRRILSNSIQDNNEAIRILLEIAKKQGPLRPESELVVKSLFLFINKNADNYQTILNGLNGQDQEENLLFVVFSKLIGQLDYEKKRESIKSMIRFLMAREILNDIGVSEVYDCLVNLGNEKLGSEIVEEVIPFIESLQTCQVIFSVRLCSKFAGNRLLLKMLPVLEKSIIGYFDGHSCEIEQDICQFLARIRDAQSLEVLMKLLKARFNQGYNHISSAIASVLDANPARIDEVLDLLYDERKDERAIIAILRSLEKMEDSVDARKIIAKVHLNWTESYEISRLISSLLVKGGKSSKPVLFEILRQDDKSKYDFALECLKRIGISNDEISAIFPKAPVLQVYNYFYKGRKNTGDLDQIWKEKGRLGDKVVANTTLLDHLLFHMFASFNFVTLNVDSSGAKGVDVVCFNPETFDIFVMGCTTGILKDDLAKMDALMKKMEAELADLFKKCSVTPIVVCSENASISLSDAEYALQNKIIIMQRVHLDSLLEMLSTNRLTREVIEYVKSIRLNTSNPWSGYH